MDEQSMARKCIDRGATAALAAIARVAVASQQGESAEGILASAMKTILLDVDGVDRDNMIEGYCDELQKFIECHFDDGPSPMERIKQKRL